MEGLLWEACTEGLFVGAGRLLEEGPFTEGPVWMVSLQRAL